MLQVVRSAVIDAPIARVWSVLREFNSHAAWHPAIERSELERGERGTRVGCVRSFMLKDGHRLREQLLMLDDHDCSLRYCILDATLPLTRYVATVRLSPVTDGDRTFWHWSSTFETPAGDEQRYAALVGDGVYQAGFDGMRTYLQRAAAADARAG